MIRTFHSVGQGAFYTEVFNGFTVVFDCGSDRNKDLVEAEINNTFEKDTRIDAVFISHLHDDHVNGLEYLLRHCHVQRLFLPLLTPEEKILLQVHNSFSGSDSDFIMNLIFEPKKTIDTRFKGTSVYLVPRSEEKDDNSELKEVDLEELSIGEISQNIKLVSNQVSGWVFIPFNFKSNERAKQLAKDLKDKKITINDADDFKNIWLDRLTQQSIIDIYRRLPGNLNTNSMVIYSGPEIGSRFFIRSLFSSRYCNMRCMWCYPRHDDAGCLYFGDFEASGVNKWDQLQSKYNQYWNQIGCVQIPHHGSRHNYHRGINSKKPMLSIISCGSSNRHRHPHSMTIRNIVLDGGIPLIVNENTGTSVSFHVLGI